MSFRRSFGGFVAAAVAGALILTGCSTSSSDGDAASETLTLGSTIPPQSFDPADAGDSNYVPYFQAAYDSLILREPDNSLAPMLAESWEVSEDNLTVTLTLRDDVTFTDGEQFDAEAVKANWEHFHAGTGAQSTQLAQFESAEVLDDYTIALHLSSPNPDILFNLSDAAGRMASPAALDEESIKTVPVGSGPYIMDESTTVQGSTYTFTKNEDYWNPDLQHYDEVVFSIYPDEVALLNALKSGQVDAGNLSNQDNVESARAADIEILQPEYLLGWGGLIIFDRTGAIVPALGDVRVRQAISHAFDTESIRTNIFLDEGKPNTQIFNAASAAYDDAYTTEYYQYDVELAKELMAEAGYADGFDLTMPTSSLFQPALLETIKSSLEAIGIRVTFEDVGTNLVSDLLAGKYAVSYMILGSTPTEWRVVSNYLTPTSTWNPLGSEDAELSALIDAIPAASDDERTELFSEINTFMMENVWFTPWLWYPENYAVNEGTDVVLQTMQNVPAIYNYSPAE